MLSGRFEQAAKSKNAQERLSPIGFRQSRSKSVNNDIKIAIAQSPHQLNIETIVEEDEDNVLLQSTKTKYTNVANSLISLNETAEAGDIYLRMSAAGRIATNESRRTTDSKRVKHVSFKDDEN